MDIRNAGEALYIASEMEKRAIRLYERALIVFSGAACRDAIQAILADERGHLCRFVAMGAETPDFDRASVLSAQAAEVLLAGGLMEAQRKGAFESTKALFAYAAEAEADAIARYSQFALQISGCAGEAFAAIAEEEKSHYARLTSELAKQK